MTSGSEDPSGAYAKRMFEPYRNALDQVSAPHAISPEDLKNRARGLLSGDSSALAVAVAHGGLGLLAQHTSYFNGFAVVLSFSQAIAVAVQPSDTAETKFIVDGARVQILQSDASVDGARPGDRVGVGVWQSVLAELQRRLVPGDHVFEYATVSSIPSYCMEAFLASLAISAARALLKMPGAIKVPDLITVCHEAILTALKAEFSKAFLMVSAQTVPDKFAVIDTEVEELLHFDAPPRSHVCWGIVDTGMAPHEVTFFHECGVQAEEALTILKRGDFSYLKSFRDVAHRDLSHLLECLPRRLRPIARHLVNENKRVQSMIHAIRKEDWQKLGGLLFMSHASLRDEWKGTDGIVDAVVAHVEAMGSEGMYGACMTGRSGSVLLVGQPLALLRCIEELKESHKKSFGEPLRALVL